MHIYCAGPLALSTENSGAGHAAFCLHASMHQFALHCAALCCTIVGRCLDLRLPRGTLIYVQLPLADSALFRAAARQPLDQVAVAELRASLFTRYTVLHHTQGRTICPWRECAGGGTVYIPTYPWPFQCENPRQTARRDKNAWAFISASH